MSIATKEIVEYAENDYTDAQLDPALELVLTRVRLLCRRRIAWLRQLWQNAGNTNDKHFSIHDEIDSHLDDLDAPESESAWLRTEEADVAALQHQLTEVENAIENDKQSRFALLHQIFGLNQEESDLFQATLAVALDPALGRVYAYLQDHTSRGYVNEKLVARLFGYGRCLLLSSESPLRTWRMISEKDVGRGEPVSFECDHTVRNWLLGTNDLDNYLVGIATMQISQRPLSSWPLEETVAFIEYQINNETQHRVRICLVGMPGSGRRTLSACISQQLGMPLLVIDADQVSDQDWMTVFVHAQRHAYLERCALAWYGKKLTERMWPQVVPGFQLQFVICEESDNLPPITGTVDYKLEMPTPTIDERRELWQRLVPAVAAWSESDFDELVKRHQVNVGQIASLAEKSINSVKEASSHLRESSRHQLDHFARILECPFEWNDLVVPESLRRNLEDILFETRERALFWEQPQARRLFPQGRGLIVLFTGPPGTGKTMAAQVIAANLGLDLYRIDLSAVVSKYVGEISKNIERVLSRAARMNAVLLCDEADALFCKRTEVKDAHDRFANTDTNYLLQAIENYPGVAMLASNKKANIDTAFIRRLRYVLEFPKPDVLQRFEIWQRIITEMSGPERLQTLAPVLNKLAESVECTGAQIKFAVLSAIFIARHENADLATPHILRGLERELLKEGLGISSRLQESLLGNKI